MEPATADSSHTQRLLAQAREGDRAAFDRLFTRHRPYLRQLVGLRLDPRLQPRVDPSDVVQETHAEAVRRLPDYRQRPAVPFRLWLRQIACDRMQMARRQHVDAARRSVHREVTVPDRSSLAVAERVLASGPSPSKQLARRELVQRVRKALCALSEADRDILLMHNAEELTGQEVALVLGIAPAAARKRYGRALLRLRKRLLEGGLRESEL
jgi:RNA polymerase sigma-70 factor (ECF subfamily)